MNAFERVQEELRVTPRTWLVTGSAGFIGSNLVEALLRLNQRVTGLDNFATGRPGNLDEVRQSVTADQWQRFQFIRGDIQNPEECLRACRGVGVILHQAALGSVPRSISDPVASHRSNVDGFIAMMLAARDAGVRRFVYASSSSIYGDHPGLPKLEEAIGRPLSPYAATKLINEIYAGVFARNYGMETIGLRYFNVFGPRQDPEGPYAAVIPKWIAALMNGDPVTIHGDGETSRDFCHVANVVQANILAGTTANPDALNQAYNVAVQQRTTLTELHRALREKLADRGGLRDRMEPVYGNFRDGDVRHSLADIGKARRLLGYEPSHDLQTGLDEALGWYQQNLSARTAAPATTPAE
jgi:UDP-N-acetylglucosamine 4-epimerase